MYLKEAYGLQTTLHHYCDNKCENSGNALADKRIESRTGSVTLLDKLEDNTYVTGKVL